MPAMAQELGDSVAARTVLAPLAPRSMLRRHHGSMKEAADWAKRVAAHPKPDRVQRCDGSESEARDLGAETIEPGDTRCPRPQGPPADLSASLASNRRRPHRASDVYRGGERKRRGADRQLAEPCQRRGRRLASLREQHEGTHDVRRSAHHGTSRFALQPSRDRAHRRPVRRRDLRLLARRLSKGIANERRGLLERLRRKVS